MGPLSFLNGAFLAALGAAALPILIHLLSRRRAREVPFAQLRFLDEITRRKVRRLRLHQWLLLLLRTLAVACLALALSRPVWHGPGAARQRGSSTVAILIDDSYSMEARLDAGALLPLGGDGPGGGSTRFAEARRRALEVIGLLEEGDRAILAFAGEPVRLPYESSVRDAMLLREEVERARPRPVRANLAAALERVHPLLAAARTLNREVFVISDFPADQAEELLSERGRRAQPGGARNGPLLPLPPETRVYLVPVPAGEADNVSITGALHEALPGAPGGRVTVRLRNHGEAPVDDLLVQAFEETTGRLLAEGFVDLGARSAGQIVLTPSAAPAAGRLAVQCAADLLERDDRRLVAAASSSRVRVLLVLGGPESDPQVAAEARFPLLALDPWGGEGDSGGEAPLFEVAALPEAELGLRGRIDADVVLLLNVGRLSAAAAELLARFREEGGGILVALGARADARLYNTLVLPKLAASRLENIEGDLDPTTRFTLRPALAGHEIFEGFPIAPGGALSGAAFQRIVGVRPGAEARVLAEFSGGRPALVEEPGVLIFASALDLSWSDFPTSAAYLPFLHRALLHLARDGLADRRERLVGAPLGAPLPGAGGDLRLCFSGPEGLELPHTIQQTERGPRLLSAPAPEPGFYELRQEGAGGPVSLEVFSVNVDPREGALAAMSREQGERLFGAEAVVLPPEREISRAVLETRYGRELWRLCLLLAVGLLVAESLLARGRMLA
ncbi:MAG: VWA domain-containing protein [Candidatus Eisenbacteria bacterium]|uniref:VWA domain-containing protein n=1 Tax=Eiseniibacteriota bacterium TaxID=2212470 RepID=A0A937XA31_UNCEI|nr:VWA domain-containing protein [Candidatus Eisenbacteria bacterium]